MKQIKFKDIEDFCDDPKLAGEVTAILLPQKGKGIGLALNSNDDIQHVVSSRNRPIYFQSVEAAIADLVDVPNLSRRIILDLSAVKANAF